MPTLPEFWTSVGIFAAVIAATLSLATLLAVLVQIGLAREELAVVKEDIALSQKQFDLSQQQFREIMRRPKLSVKVMRVGEEEAFATLEDGSRPRIVTLRFIVTNEGDAVARDILLEVFIQHDHLAAFAPLRVPFGNDEMETTAGVTYFLHPDSTTYIRYDFRKPADDGQVIYPMGHTLDFVGLFLFRPKYKFTRPLWRVFDQYALYPDRAEWSDQFGRFPDLYLTSKQ